MLKNLKITGIIEFYILLLYYILFRFIDCEELGGYLRSQLLGYLLPGGLHTNIILQLTSKGSKVRLHLCFLVSVIKDF